MNKRRPRLQIKELTYVVTQALKPLQRDVRKIILRHLQYYWWQEQLRLAQQAMAAERWFGSYYKDTKTQKQMESRTILLSVVREMVHIAPETNVWRCTHVQRNKHTKKWERYLFWIANIDLLCSHKRVYPCEARLPSDGWIYNK